MDNGGIPTKKLSDDGKEQASKFDFNLYTTKKTVANSLLDVALFMANATQLRNLILSDSYSRSKIHLMTLVLVSTSLVLQVLVGICLLRLAQLNINEEGDRHWETRDRAENWNNWVTAGIFLVTVTNGLISTLE